MQETPISGILRCWSRAGAKPDGKMGLDHIPLRGLDNRCRQNSRDRDLRGVPLSLSLSLSLSLLVVTHRMPAPDGR